MGGAARALQAIVGLRLLLGCGSFWDVAADAPADNVLATRPALACSSTCVAAFWRNAARPSPACTSGPPARRRKWDSGCGRLWAQMQPDAAESRARIRRGWLKRPFSCAVSPRAAPARSHFWGPAPSRAREPRFLRGEPGTPRCSGWSPADCPFVQPFYGL